MQRTDTQQSRQQLSEQAYLANRAIGQGATARGLGSSGLKNLGVIQSQMAQGQGVNQISQNNANVQRAAMGTRVSLQEQLAAGTNAANANYSQNVIDADKYGVQVDAEKRDTLLQLYQMAMEGGSAADIAKLATLSGLDMASLSEDEQAALTGATTSVEALSSLGLSREVVKQYTKYGVTGSVGVDGGLGTLYYQGKAYENNARGQIELSKALNNSPAYIADRTREANEAVHYSKFLEDFLANMLIGN